MSIESRVPIHKEHDIVAARQSARQVATAAGFTGSDLTIIATAISEIARNIISYAEHGEIIIKPLKSQDRSGILIVAEDIGPGIANVEQAMQDGFSTGNSLGLGLPGARRLMDEFSIDSVPGKGTKITMTKWVSAR